jgi:1-deoxy-D-xylulose-5-phosphate reductoisomerase
MGPKITIDSSTLMNKGLEVIEAHELFGVPYDRIEVVVHPQSIIHSMVEFTDGCTMAQLSLPDMRLPIGYALAYPYRIGTPFGRIDWGRLGRLDFEQPDTATFRCLPLAYEAGRMGSTAPAWLSAANEVAVEAFLARALAAHRRDLRRRAAAVRGGPGCDGRRRHRCRRQGAPGCRYRHRRHVLRLDALVARTPTGRP